jgi:hypothetical protein
LQGMGVEDTTNYAKELLFIECQTKKTTWPESLHWLKLWITEYLTYLSTTKNLLKRKKYKHYSIHLIRKF